MLEQLHHSFETTPINLDYNLSRSREPRYRLPIGLLGQLDRFLLRPRFFMLRCALVVQIAVHLHEQLLHVVGQSVHGGVPVPACVLRQCSEHSARAESALQWEKVKNAEAHIGKIASLDSVMRTTTFSLFHKNIARSATWKCWLIRHSEMR